MGAIAGSWAGLHGPGEKTIEKAGQSDPGLCEGFGEWKERGPGQRGLQAAGIELGWAGSISAHWTDAPGSRLDRGSAAE